MPPSGSSNPGCFRTQIVFCSKRLTVVCTSVSHRCAARAVYSESCGLITWPGARGIRLRLPATQSTRWAELLISWDPLLLSLLSGAYGKAGVSVGALHSVTPSTSKPSLDSPWEEL